MTHPPSIDLTVLSREQLRALQTSLGQAKDPQLGRLVAMLDAMPERGALDDLIEPLRPRLLHLRPERPLRFARLLFLPLDPIIVPANVWQRDRPTIPRTAVTPMAAAVRAAIGPLAGAVDSMIAGRGARDAGAIARAGALLWPAAGPALAAAGVPAIWSDRTALPHALWAEVAGNTAAVMAQVPRLNTLVAEAQVGVGPRVDMLEAMIQALRVGRPRALSMLVALILARLPESTGFMAEAFGRSGDMIAATGLAKGAMLDRLDAPDAIEAAVMGAGAADAALEVRRIAALLRALYSEAASARRPRVQQLLQRLDKACVRRFTTGLRVEFLEPLLALAVTAGDEAVVALEDAARGLAELGEAARQVGSAATYDTLLRQTVAAIRAMPAGGPLSLADRVRMVELLVGPEEAWAMLEARR